MDDKDKLDFQDTMGNKLMVVSHIYKNGADAGGIWSDEEIKTLVHYTKIMHRSARSYAMARGIQV